MANELVTLATFSTPVEAGFVKGLLESEGIHAYLADQMTTGMLWHYSNAIGWVKLQVAETDVARAKDILEAQKQTRADLGKEEFAAEATSSPDTDSVEEPAAEATAEAAGESEDEIENPIDELAARALRAAGFGLVFCPLTLYSAWLIGRLVFSKAELSDTASRRMWIAFGLTLISFLAYATFFRLIGP